MSYSKSPTGLVRETFAPGSDMVEKADAQVWIRTYETVTEFARVRASVWYRIFCWLVFSKREYSDRHPDTVPQTMKFARPISAAEAALWCYGETHTPPYQMKPDAAAVMGPDLQAPWRHWADPNKNDHTPTHATNYGLMEAESVGYLDGRPPEERRRFY